MRGGRFQQKSSEDASIRNAEALFESRTVAEIREVEAQTRQEIEEKKEELRQLVGASYRDLIESADSIVCMKNSCEGVAANIDRMEKGFRFLKNSTAVPTEAPMVDREKKRREKLYGIGSRVKYIVDTPEKIWGCLDEHMYLEGAQRFLRAREVHMLLSEKETQGEQKELLAHFPLLRHQWQLVETFRGQISERSRDRLLEPGLDVNQYAVAVAAISVIDLLNPSQALSLFLETRRTWLRIHLRMAIAEIEKNRMDKTSDKDGKKFERVRTNGNAVVSAADAQKLTGIGTVKREHGKMSLLNGKTIVDQEKGMEWVSAGTFEVSNIALVFSKLANMIQMSLCQAGQLFLQVNEDSPLFFSSVLSSPPGLQLFGGMPNPEEEVELWKLHREKLENAMMPLTGKFISESCISWIQMCEEDLMAEGNVLLDFIEWGKQLAEVELSVRNALDSQDALESSMEWLKSAFGPMIDSPWLCVSGLVLKEPVNLWDTLFERMFVKKAKVIIDSELADIRIRDMVDSCLASIGPCQSVGGIDLQIAGAQILGLDFSNSRWFPVTQLDARLTEWPKILMGGSLTFQEDGKEWFGMSKSHMGLEVVQIKEEIDQKLRVLLEDMNSFLQSQWSSSRSEDIVSYLQKQCFLHVSNIVEELQERLLYLFDDINDAAERASQSIEDPKNLLDNLNNEENGKNLTRLSEVEISSSVERALFLGRLFSVLAYHSSSLPAALGSLNLWKLEEKSIAGNSSKVFPPLWHRSSLVDADKLLVESSGNWLLKSRIDRDVKINDGNNIKFSSLQSSLRCSSFVAHGIWISWSTEELPKILAKDLWTDDELSSSIPLKGWEDTVIKQQMEDGNELDVQLPLPAMPSSYVISFLFRSCQEIYRVGGHFLDRTILQLFIWRLLEKVSSVYGTFLSDSNIIKCCLSEKGALQLLFDLRFLGDVLSGGQYTADKCLEFLEDKTHNSLVSTSLAMKMKELVFLKDSTAVVKQPFFTSLLEKLSRRVDPIDWATYEPHLWENERRSYQKCAVLFGFIVQLNHLYKDTVQKIPSNADSNMLKVSSAVPRFSYLPISTPLMMKKVSSNDEVGGGSWKSFSNTDSASKFRLEDDSSFESTAGARPLFKSIMSQVGSKFGEGTFKLGSMLTDGQVSRLKDRSAAAISTFGEILPVQAAGLLSSFTAGASRVES